MNVLVAEAFLPIPEEREKYEVHHKNLDSLDNRATNLMFIEKNKHRELHEEIERKRK